jgi:pimeloyl-ACP methyl ester carboxylesterase
VKRAGLLLTLVVAASGTVHAQDGAPPPFSPPGRLVDVGGWRLHLNCIGKADPARPTVILEAGAGDFSVEWSLVQPRVASFARVCSYDRAGDGWSDLGPHPRTMHQVAYELHTLLENAGERPPYVLVGHSYGGWLVRIYRSVYPSEVAGMVLVEGGADNPLRIMPDGSQAHSADLASGRPIPPINTSTPLRISDIPPQALAQMKAGLDAASRHANEPPRDKLPPDAQRMRTWALGQLGHVAAAVNPYTEEELAQLRAEHPNRERAYGDMPLVVISRGRPEEDVPIGHALEEERTKEYAALASLSRKGQHTIAPLSGHHVQIEEPDLVVTAIRHVLPAAPKEQ